jgi:hypothetical protein
MDWKMVVYGELMRNVKPEWLFNQGADNKSWLNGLPVPTILTYPVRMHKDIDMAKDLEAVMTQHEVVDELTGETTLSRTACERFAISSAAVPPSWWKPMKLWLGHVARNEIPFPQFLIYEALQGHTLIDDPTEGHAVPYGRDNLACKPDTHCREVLVRLSVLFCAIGCQLKPTEVDLRRSFRQAGLIFPAVQLREGPAQTDFASDNLKMLEAFWPGMRAHQPQLPGTQHTLQTAEHSTDQQQNIQP